jgi:diguanylate cyclase (GGDEF)-like protein
LPDSSGERPADDERATISGVTAFALARDPLTAFLVVIYGSELGKRIPLGQQPLECGRSPQCGLPLDDEAISRRHARFSWDGTSYVVADLGSTNGTLVNDVAVKEKSLLDGDRIQIGHAIFKFIQGGNVELSYHEEIYRLMTFDGLTRAHNKRAFGEALEREVSRARRYKRPLSLVLFDLDHFKRVNDTYGHLAGDAVLRHAAGVVSANVRREDMLARVGGEEFALLTPEISLAGARVVAEKLRALLERTPVPLEHGPLPVSASFGAATLGHDPPMSVDELYADADARLYAAKRGGRNRVA